ncbi:Transposable element P transposase [Amphibalanus amphitrite]|uniref:Transposable element P transposase n=2 Tax=Amphibalanus amphitrite TaxID=1232801 RepID=A0A6A4WPQ8_AMPAM|nr:Transposable element P transposase [Amphibalanus amphitrite]
MEKDGGLLFQNDHGGSSLLGRGSFEELLARDAGELRLCPKLTDMCIEASGAGESRATIDAWFDVHNSRAPYDAKDERCAYGVSPTIKTRQDEALAAMDRLMQTAKKVSKKHPSGRSAPLPCQRGVQRSNASLRGLLVDVRAACPDVRHIMTSHVNQDCVENAFSQMRSMCGSNTTPDAVEARVRLRIMLMAPSPLAAVRSRGCPVEVEPQTDFLTTGAQPLPATGNITNAAFEGLDVQLRDPADEEAAEQHEQWEAAYQSAMGQPPLPPAPPAHEDNSPDTEEAGPSNTRPRTAELGVNREALAFVAGYVAFKCRQIRGDLGQPTSSSLAPASVPSRWLETISRGSLYVPSQWWMGVVEDFNDTFSDVMGPTAVKTPGIVKRLTGCVLARAPGLDERIARKLASTRLHLRLRWLNTARAAAEAEKYQLRKLAQHAKSKR